MPQEEYDSLMDYLKKELEAALVRNDSLEKENRELKQEVARLKAQVSSLKAHDNERKSMLWKKLHNSNDNGKIDASPQKPSDHVVKVSEKDLEHLISRPSIQELAAKKERQLKAPIPPSAISAMHKEVNANKLHSPQAPPPPPPLPSKVPVGSKSIHRTPEVIEFYRYLTKKDAHLENKTNSAVTPAVAFTLNMIGEIENRSPYLSAIKSDVEKQKEFISFLIKEVESAAFTDISHAEAFVKWLDSELSTLVDERAVLKHFPQWPERKADALREASVNYRDLMNLETEVKSFKHNPKEPLVQALGRVQALQDRLERSVNNIERIREHTIKRYRDFQIPWEWLLTTGMVGQVKLSTLRLAREYMERITRELLSTEGSRDDNLLLQGARFAYRLHQFVGGFDTVTLHTFQEMKKIGMSKSQAIT